MSTRRDILTQVANGELTPEQAEARLTNRRPRSVFSLNDDGTVTLSNVGDGDLRLPRGSWFHLKKVLNSRSFSGFMRENRMPKSE